MFDLFGNGTIAPPVNWQPEPSTRGTTDILSTCLITLGLCLWSALHLNIPQHGKTSQQKWRKCGWLVLGLLAPEMIAYTAWAQLRAAKKLDDEMKRLLGEAPNPSLRDKVWGLLRAERNGRFKSTAGRDPEEGNYTEQHDEYQTGEENMRPRQSNAARADQPPGTASHESQPRAADGLEGGHFPVIMDSELNPSKIDVAGKGCQLVDEDKDHERRTSHGSETRHDLNPDQVDAELRGEDGAASHPHPESAERTTQSDGKTIVKKRRHPWTMTHSFYAVMGGFAFDTSDAEPNFLPNHRSRLCISVQGLSYIAEKAPELIPDIAEKHIKDKSKADSLAKFLVCLQALWFCVQCITRVSQREAISLLELNTFAHAFCALLIYALWWDKPQNIEEPTLLQGQKEWEMCAFLCMNSGEREAQGGPEFGMTDRPTMEIVWDPFAIEIPASASNYVPNLGTYSVSSEGNPYHRITPDKGLAITLNHGDVIFGFRCEQSKTAQRSGRNHETLRIESPRLRRLELYSNATKSFEIEKYHHHLWFDYSRPACDFMPNWPLDKDFDDSALLHVWRDTHDSARLGSLVHGLILAGLLYGGLHLLAWKVPFASRAERILWRFSGIFIISAGIGFTGLTYFSEACVHISAKFSATVKRTMDPASDAFFLLVSFIICLGYVLARIFLVVECFLQLSRLPASAYETPEWSAYFPHIS